MVHTFKILDRNFMLDVESGSVYEIDEITKKLIDYRISPLDNSKGDFSSYAKKELSEANEEIEELIQNKTLFTESEKYPQPKYSGIVKALCLNICHNCNLNCEYCFADGGSYMGDKQSMSFEVAKKAIDFLLEKSGKRRNLEIDFFGGEPLLNLEVVKQAVAYGRSKEIEWNKNFRFTITTNAIALDNDAIDFFNKEMYNVVVSIDGRKNVHNTVRKTINGKDSFDIALNNALEFRKKRGDKTYYIRGTYTALNKDFCEDVLAINDYGFDQISIEPVVLPESHRLALQQADVPSLCDEYEKLAREYLIRRKTDNKWFNFFHFMLDLTGGPCAKKRLVGCGAGNEYLAIVPNGDIYPCHQFAGNIPYKIGNILENTFNKDIPNKFACCNLTTKPNCLECWAKYFCSGGCSANSINFCNDMNMPYKISCELMKKRIECAIAINSIENEKLNSI